MKGRVTRRLGASVMLAAAVLTAASPAPALVEKVMTMCGGQLCPSFRPTVPVPEGWYEDYKTGTRLGVRLFVPGGETFETAPALIYAMARPLHEGEDVTAAVGAHHETWRHKAPGVAIRRLDDIRRNGGLSFQLHDFVSPKLGTQPYERVATGMDKDGEGNHFIVRIVLTGKSEAAIKGAEQAFVSLLTTY
jgi:hypothetical protein